MRRLEWMLSVVAVVALEATASVNIPGPQVKVSSPAAIRGMTGGTTEAGCTTFQDVALSCDCRKERDGWRLIADIRATPHVYIANFKYLEHEMLHIWDFRRLLGEHVKALGALRFASRKECDQHAISAAIAFPDTMERVARLSAAKRDGRHQYSAEDHLIVVQARIAPPPALELARQFGMFVSRVLDSQNVIQLVQNFLRMT
jgi:hypothetical protein